MNFVSRKINVIVNIIEIKLILSMPVGDKRLVKWKTFRCNILQAFSLNYDFPQPRIRRFQVIYSLAVQSHRNCYKMSLALHLKRCTLKTQFNIACEYRSSGHEARMRRCFPREVQVTVFELAPRSCLRLFAGRLAFTIVVKGISVQIGQMSQQAVGEIGGIG